MVWQRWNVRKRQGQNWEGIETWFEVEYRDRNGRRAFGTGPTVKDADASAQDAIRYLDNPTPSQPVDQSLPF